MCQGGYTRRELPNNITLNWLKDQGARCKDALKWFESTFPFGGSLTNVLTKCTNRDWVFWLLYKS